jgi:carboxypeptidase Taq
VSYSALARRVATIVDLVGIMQVLTWDARTQMPPGGAWGRSHQMASLTSVARDMLLDATTARLLDAADSDTATLPEDRIERQTIAQLRDAIALHRRIPAELLTRRSELAAATHDLWVEARKNSDFSSLAGNLEQTFDLARELADAIGYETTPYDALLGLYEPGSTSAGLDAIFGELCAGLLPLLADIAEKPAPRTDFLRRKFPIERQREMVRRIGVVLGYDLTRGRIDDVIHPFEVAFDRDDVRVTASYDENWLMPALTSSVHENGHAIYEQHVDPSLKRTIMVADLGLLYGTGGPSYGMHESQSRLFENHVGRSRSFWQAHYAIVCDLFAEQLADVDADTFWRGFSAVMPGLTHFGADEVTHDLQVLVRVDLERAVIERRLAVRDLPEAWNARMKDLLGVTVPNDTQGVLQDVHWPTGQIGTFANYAVGSVMAAQVFTAASADPAVSAGCAVGDYTALRGWLGDKLYRHGRRYSRREALRRATGKTDDTAPYIAYLNEKYRDLYAIG